METFDTNVVVRLLVDDDPEQSAAALRCGETALGRYGAFLPKVVLAETIWVLAQAYRFERAAILDAVGRYCQAVDSRSRMKRRCRQR